MNSKVRRGSGACAMKEQSTVGHGHSVVRHGPGGLEQRLEFEVLRRRFKRRTNLQNLMQVAGNTPLCVTQLIRPQPERFVSAHLVNYHPLSERIH